MQQRKNDKIKYIGMFMQLIDEKDVRINRHKGVRIGKKTRIGKRKAIPLLSIEGQNIVPMRLMDAKDIRSESVGKPRIHYIDEFKDLRPYYWDNPYSPLYLNIVQRYIRKIVNAQKKGKYWTMSLDEKVLKVRHLAAVLRTGFNEYSWHYPIKFDKRADAFLLSAFTDKRTLDPMHLWFIRKNEIIEIGELHKQLWDRSELVINAKTIDIFRRYEMYEQLTELKDIMEVVSLREEERNKNDLKRRLVIKQNEIRKKMGYSFNLEFMIRQAIYTGLSDLEKHYGIDKFGEGEFEEIYDVRLDLINELEYFLNKEELDKELIDILKNLSAVFNMRINELIEMSMSYGLEMLNVDIALDMIKVEEFMKMNRLYHGQRHTGGWRGRKEYIKRMNPIIREGLSNILREFYLDMLK